MLSLDFHKDVMTSVSVGGGIMGAAAGELRNSKADEILRGP